jgi:hypothetical protein
MFYQFFVFFSLKAYKNFGTRISNLRKRLDDVKKTLPDPLSPIPSPTLDAPSPVESPVDTTADNTEAVDMELSDGAWPYHRKLFKFSHVTVRLHQFAVSTFFLTIIQNVAEA